MRRVVPEPPGASSAGAAVVVSAKAACGTASNPDAVDEPGSIGS